MLPPPSLSNWQNNGPIINSLLCIKAFFFSYFMLIWVLYEQWLTITLQGTQKVVSLILEVNMAQVAGVTSLYVMYSSAFLILLHMICLIRKCTEAGLTQKATAPNNRATETNSHITESDYLSTSFT